MKNTPYLDIQPLEDFDWDNYNTDKYNEKVKLTDKDVRQNRKILCKEPYAQELYDKMVAHEESRGENFNFNKDLEIGKLYEVVASSVCFKTTTIKANEIDSDIEISIPFKEYSGDIDDLLDGKNQKFKVIIYRSTGNCEFFASEKKSRSINYKEELIKNFNDNRWFEVKIKSLIKGGYIASYKNEIECFIPGSQAGANVIRDFSILLNKTINVMVDNYDKTNNLFIVSYKKYIKHSLPHKISDIRFGKEYTGKLTTNPYPFGMFIELDSYYTGLLHSSEFKNYESVKKTMIAGDTIELYVKGVTMKKKEYRIILTLDRDSINQELLQWDSLKDQIENKLFDFTLNESRDNTIDIYIDGNATPLVLENQYKNVNVEEFNKIHIHKVNALEKSISYTLVS